MRSGLLVLALVIGSACGDTIINVPNPTAPTTPVKEEPKVITSKVEFRVVGNANSVRIRYSNPVDGLVQTVTSLPFFTSFSSTDSILFLSLDVTPISFPLVTAQPFLSAQIFVNGNLFREASTLSDSLTNTLTVNGTWRR